MRWIAASLLAINVLVLLAQLLLVPEPAADISGPAPALEGQPLVLLDELAATELATMVADKERSRQAVQVAQRDSQKPMCTMVGPFPELLQAEYFVERLAALEVSAVIQDIETPGDVSYWIYLPPRDSRKQAFAELRELQAKGIDSFVIPKGELANGISFGMFSQANLARSRLDDMRSRGYPVELKEVARSYRETWVLVPAEDAAVLSTETWLEILATGEELERRQNFCPAVASASNIL